MTLLPGLGIDIMTFTPVARMAEDTFLLWVHKDTGITDVNQFRECGQVKGQ
jgi:tripartite-type tricarboxylate transporter receptor subunit TctC